MMPLRKEDNMLTYDQYLSMGENVKYEIIDGELYNMSPSPSVKHQTIAKELVTEFNIYLRGKKCEVIPEIDVSLEGLEDVTKIREWVRPDISVICDKSKKKENHIAGAPDLVIEILSKSTAQKDKVTKFNLYKNSGVKEYWIVDPAYDLVEVYFLENKEFVKKGTFSKQDKVKVNIFDDLFIDLDLIF